MQQLRERCSSMKGIRKASELLTAIQCYEAKRENFVFVYVSIIYYCAMRCHSRNEMKIKNAFKQFYKLFKDACM